MLVLRFRTNMIQIRSDSIWFSSVKLLKGVFSIRKNSEVPLSNFLTTNCFFFSFFVSFREKNAVRQRTDVCNDYNVMVACLTRNTAFVGFLLFLSRSLTIMASTVFYTSMFFPFSIWSRPRLEHRYTFITRLFFFFLHFYKTPSLLMWFISNDSQDSETWRSVIFIINKWCKWCFFFCCFLFWKR